jgi:sigma-E factor negative regulatory protein RseB
MRIWIIMLLGVSSVARADPGAPARDGLGWLKKMANASRQVNYTGTFVYQHGSQVETSRVAHYVNGAGGEFERLETLDGPPREVIRSNDQVTCYLPNVKTVLIEQRSGRHFPALLPERLSGIGDNYDVKEENSDRVAGFDCVWVALVPRDSLRYGRRFCAEKNTGLPLRARTFNEKNELVESFAFTQVSLGGGFNRDNVKSKYAERSKAQSWRIDRSALNIAADVPADTGWVLNSRPAGFKKMMEVKRSLSGRSGTVSHIVFSDGLAAVSVFIEAMPKSQPAQSLSHQGAVNIFTKPYGNHVVTVLGEAPATTVMQIANSLELKSAAAAVR